MFYYSRLNLHRLWSNYFFLIFLFVQQFLFHTGFSYDEAVWQPLLDDHYHIDLAELAGGGNQKGGLYLEKQIDPKETMVDVINNLGIKLLAIHNVQNDNNIAISPYGAVSVLAALSEGIQGDASREIIYSSRMPTNKPFMRVGLRDIHRHLKSYFIPEEGFLAGLTLNLNNVSLKNDYENVLKFYGFDYGSFNNPFYNEPSTTEKPNEGKSTTLGTSFGMSDQTTEAVTKSNTETTTIKLSVTESRFGGPKTTSTTQASVDEISTPVTIPSTPKETTIPSIPTTLSSSSLTTTQTTTIPTTTILTTTTTTTEPPERNRSITTIKEYVETTISGNDPTKPFSTAVSRFHSTEQETFEFMSQGTTQMLNNTTMETTTKMIQGSDETEAARLTTTSISATTQTLTTESTGTTETKAQTEMSTTKPPTTTVGSTTIQESATTPSIETTKDSMRSTREITGTVPENQLTTTVTIESSTSSQEPSTTTTPITTTSSTETPTTPTTTMNILDTSTDEISTDSSATILTTTNFDEMQNNMASTTPFFFDYQDPTTDFNYYDFNQQRENATDQQQTPIYSDISATGVEGNRNLRQARSVVDYVIARYYDVKYIPSAPKEPYRPYTTQQEPLTFAIYGKYQEAGVNFMKYDTALPFFYVANLNTLALSFPLDNAKYYLLLLLPIDYNGVDQLICDLSVNPNLRFIIENLRLTHVTATIPSFALKGFVTLTPSLQKLGIRRIFEPRQSDFSLMTEAKDIYVTNIEQAVTVTIKNYLDPSAQHYKHLLSYPPVQFKADHPFVYIVMDSELNVALMIGKIVNPLNSRIR